MTRTVVTRKIDAPVAAVFQAISDVEHLPEVVPCVARVELLSEQRSGVGTRFRETRLMKGKEHVVELEVTEHVPDDRLRIVTDSHGTVWDTVFTVGEADGGTVLELAMDARAHKLLPRVLNPILKPLYRKGVEEHVDAVKRYCEEGAHSAPV